NPRQDHATLAVCQGVVGVGRHPSWFITQSTPPLPLPSSAQSTPRSDQPRFARLAADPLPAVWPSPSTGTAAPAAALVLPTPAEAGADVDVDVDEADVAAAALASSAKERPRCSSSM